VHIIFFRFAVWINHVCSSVSDKELQASHTHTNAHTGLQGCIKQMSVDRFSLAVIEHSLSSYCVSLYQLPLALIPLTHTLSQHLP